jgi:hypothetical protein
MERNDKLKFYELHTTEHSLLAEMIQIQKNTTTSRADHVDWASHLRFLCVPRAGTGEYIQDRIIYI